MENLEKKLRHRIRISEEIVNELIHSGEKVSSELASWRKEEERNGELYKEVTRADFLWEQHAFYSTVDSAADLKAFRQKRAWRGRVRRCVAAAIFLLLIGVAGYLLLWSDEGTKRELPMAEVRPAEGEKVVLVMNGGKIVTLPDKKSVVIRDGEMTESSGEQGMTYENGAAVSAGTTEVTQNRLIVPRGKTYFLILEDGTRVWMNAESELIYSVPFAGDKREVKLKGEAYFEVAKDVTRPFRVNTEEVGVVVTGTAFNVQAYQDDEQIDVTLVKGGVRVLSQEREVAVLKPSQCFQMDARKGTFEVKTACLSTALAWRENLMVFKNESLSSILRRLARWYDVEFEVDERVGRQVYSGTISREESMDSVFSILRLTNEIELVMKPEKKVEVIPKK